MKTYSFDCIKTDGAIYTCDVFECRGDAEALARAAALFASHADAATIEVWADGERVGRVDRPGA